MSSNSDHYPALDGLRGLAAFTVLLSHFSNATGFLGGIFGRGGGQYGVLLFFVLSGFLMGRLYFPKAVSWHSVGDFYRRRFARVVPLYLVLVLASYLLWKWRGQHFPLYGINDENILAHLTFWAGQGVMWTVVLEVKFYVIFPLIWLAARYLGDSAKWWFILIGTGLILAPTKWGELLHHAPAFFIGMAIAMSSQQRNRTFDWLFVASVAIYFLTFPQVFSLFGIGELRPQMVWTGVTHYAVATCLFVSALCSPIAARVLGSSVGRFTGAISYSVYLLHVPVLAMLKQLPFLRANHWLFLLVLVIAVTFAAWISFVTIERPTRRWLTHPHRWRFGGKRTLSDATRRLDHGQSA